MLNAPCSEPGHSSGATLDRLALDVVSTTTASALSLCLAKLNSSEVCQVFMNRFQVSSGRLTVARILSPISKVIGTKDAPQPYSGSIFASLTILAHFSVSEKRTT